MIIGLIHMLFRSRTTWSGLSLEQMTVKVTTSENSIVTHSYAWQISEFVFPLASSSATYRSGFYHFSKSQN